MLKKPGNTPFSGLFLCLKSPDSDGESGSEPTTLKELNQALGKETIDLYNTSDTRDFIFYVSM